MFSKDENGILSTDQDFIVDITPSKNILLKAGTSEYDVPSGNFFLSKKKMKIIISFLFF